MNLTLDFDKRNLAILGLALLLLFGTFYHFNTVNQHEAKLKQEKNLQNALGDTLKTYKNKENQWVSEKLTLQADTKELKDKNLTLTSNQSELIKKVDEINKHNQIISAALIQMGVKLDGMVNTNAIVENDSTIEFPKNSDTIKYNILVHNVKQTGFKKPVLEFKEFSLPNKQLVEFHWKDERKEGYPISFTVTNSNPYYKVYNLDSYAIPELQKTTVKPSFWNKVGTFSKTWGGRAIFIGVGVLVGAALVK